jgi:GGDEF domain-containing protein
MQFSTSIGYARYPADGADADTVMDVADGRMYENKIEIHVREAKENAEE